MSDSRPDSRPKTWGAILGTLVGLLLVGWLLASYGWREVLDLLRRAGWSIAGVVLFHWVQILFSALAWQAVAGPMRPQPSLPQYVWLRWIREGVNNLLPVAQLGGLVVAVRLLRRGGVPLTAAVAGTVSDFTMEVLTQVLFTLLGLALLVLIAGESRLALYVLGGAVVAATAAGALVAAQWYGMAGAAGRVIMRLAARFGVSPLGPVTGLDSALRALYRNPSRMAWACTHHSLSWVLGGTEVCLALHILGTDTGFAEGLAIEALGQAVKAAGFAVPGGIGVTEGGYVAVCHLFGLTPELAIALGLIKRLREVVLGVPALVAWRVREGRTAGPGGGARTTA